MNSLKEFWAEKKILLIVVIAAVIVGIVGILSLKIKQFSLLTPLPQPTILNASTWQTYRSDEFGFEVKYPNDWSIYDTDTASELKSVTFIKEPSGEGFDMFSRAVSIIIELNPKRHIPTIEWYKNEWAKQILVGINFDNVKFEETIFQELPALKASNAVFFARGLYMFRAEWGVIDFGNADAQLVQLTEQTFNQILSTFRFVEKDPEPVYKTIPALWEDALYVLHSGQVEGVFQAHDFSVHLYLKDRGATIVTKQPRIDLIYDEIEKCGENCKDIVIETE